MPGQPEAFVTTQIRKRNKQWKSHAAVTAAAYAKEILLVVPRNFPEERSVEGLPLPTSVADTLLLTRSEDDRNDLTNLKGPRAGTTCEWFI
jgi:hypothetical protein